jgi:hypothetical protein
MRVDGVIKARELFENSAPNPLKTEEFTMK